MRFTKEEFDTMVRELLFRTPASFDMLCRIAEKALKTRIEGWCNSDIDLRGGQHADDIMQEVHIRLIKKTVPFFLLRNGIEGEYNNDPEGFEAWMITVAKNLKRDYAKKIRPDIFQTVSLETDVADTTAQDFVFPIHKGETNEKLAKALSIVLSSDLVIYKKLTWLAQAVFVVRDNISKIEATHRVIEKFENKTLTDMYTVLLDAVGNISWMTVTYEQHTKIMNALYEETENGVPFGETMYKESFMKYKGAESGNKSISDWTNRINDMLYRKIEGKDPPRKKGKRMPPKIKDDKAGTRNIEDKTEAENTARGKSSNQADDEKRSGGNETFNC